MEIASLNTQNNTLNHGNNSRASKSKTKNYSSTRFAPFSENSKVSKAEHAHDGTSTTSRLKSAKRVDPPGASATATRPRRALGDISNANAGRDAGNGDKTAAGPGPATTTTKSKQIHTLSKKRQTSRTSALSSSSSSSSSAIKPFSSSSSSSPASSSSSSQLSLKLHEKSQKPSRTHKLEPIQAHRHQQQDSIPTKERQTSAQEEATTEVATEEATLDTVEGDDFEVDTCTRLPFPEKPFTGEIDDDNDEFLYGTIFGSKEKNFRAQLYQGSVEEPTVNVGEEEVPSLTELLISELDHEAGMTIPESSFPRSRNDSFDSLEDADPSADAPMEVPFFV